MCVRCYRIRIKPRKMCVMMLWSSVAVNVGGWRRVAGMEVLATFTSRDPRSGWCTNYVQRIVRISPSFCVTWQINVKVGDGDGVQLDLFILNSMAIHIYKNKSKILPTILSQKSHPFLRGEHTSFCVRKISVFVRPSSMAPGKPYKYFLHTNQAPLARFSFSRWVFFFFAIFVIQKAMVQKNRMDI